MDSDLYYPPLCGSLCGGGGGGGGGPGGDFFGGGVPEHVRAAREEAVVAAGGGGGGGGGAVYVQGRGGRCPARQLFVQGMDTIGRYAATAAGGGAAATVAGSPENLTKAPAVQFVYRRTASAPTAAAGRGDFGSVMELGVDGADETVVMEQDLVNSTPEAGGAGVCEVTAPGVRGRSRGFTSFGRETGQSFRPVPRIGTRGCHKYVFYLRQGNPGLNGTVNNVYVG